MEKIRVLFLGTGNAIPTKKRNHTAILLSYKNENILVDCGEGTQRQFNIAGISPTKLTRVLITHWHGDHILGIPGLLQTLWMLNYNKTLKIYGPIGTKNFFSLISSLIKVRINFELIEIENDKIDCGDFDIETLLLEHEIPSNGYSFLLKDKRRLDKDKLKKFKLPNSPLLGKLQKGCDIVFNGKKIKAKDVSFIEKGKKITFVLDTAKNENAVKLAKNSDILICESTFSDEEKEIAEEYKHLTAKQAAEIAKKSNVKKLILTHLSQRYEHNSEIILKEAKKIFKNTIIAEDFENFEL